MPSSRSCAPAVLLGLFLAAAGAPPSQDPVPAKPPQDPVPPKSAPQRTAVQSALDEIRKVLSTAGRVEAERVAPQLRALGEQELSERDRESWLRLARDAALRLGDRAWLESLRAVPNSFSNDVLYGVLLAMAQLERADLVAARATLGNVDLDGANPREERRAYAVLARVAQLEGKVAEERGHVEAMIDHLASWPRQRCQSCHGPVDHPEILSSLPIDRLWFGERYVELLRQQGDAEAVRRAAAERLAADPKDDDARIHLAFALQALDRRDEAQRTFQALPWADFAGRDLRKPRMMTSFP